MHNNGIENENQIINEINGKKIEDLSPNFKEPIKGMFKYQKDGDVIVAKKVSNWIGCKTDIEIYLDNYYHNISIKSGFGPAVHEEEFDSFYEFLRTLHISRYTLDTIKFYHYADGSLSGIGTKTLRLDEFKEKYSDRIAKANEELNQDEIVKAVIYRAIIKGRKEKNQEINYLYYGNANEGVFIRRVDILDYAYKLPCYDNKAIHFGPLVYAQKIHRKKVGDGKVVQYSQLSWPNIKEGVIKIKELSLEGASFKEQKVIEEPKKEEKKKITKKELIIVGLCFAICVILLVCVITLRR
jgi:hypothetical protein